MRQCVYAFFLVLFPLSFSTLIAHAAPFPVERNGKQYYCDTKGRGYFPVQRIGKKNVPYTQSISKLKLQISKTSAAKKLKSLKAKLAALKNEEKAAKAACKSGPQPAPTNTPVGTPEPTAVPDALSLETYSGPITKENIRLLLERSAYGLSSREANIAALGAAQGIAAAVDELMRVKDEPADLNPRVTDRLDGQLGNLTTQQRNSFNSPSFARAELDFAINTNNPFRSNFQHFLLGLWTVGANVLDSADKQYLWWDYWNEILYKTALNPNLPEMLQQVGKHPLMLIYLDGSKNKYTESGAAVNENYAREILELFSMGPSRIDRATGQVAENYVEERDGNRTRGDIYRLAKLLTGFATVQLVDGNGIQQWRSVFSPADHYSGAETLFEGTPWAFTATDNDSAVRGIFANHPAVRDYLAREILQWYLTPNPPQKLVEALGDQIHANNYDLTIPLRTLFSSKAFYHPDYTNTLPKTSHQVLVELARTMGLYRTPAVATNLEGGVNVANFTGNAGAAGNLFRIGYDTTTPPDVFSYRDSLWTSGSTLLETLNMVYALVNDTTTQSRISWTASVLLPTEGVYTPVVVDRLAETFGCQSLTPSQRLQIEFYMNNVRSGATYTKRLFDNQNATHVREKVPNVIAMLSTQPCFLLK